MDRKLFLSNVRPHTENIFIAQQKNNEKILTPGDVRSRKLQFVSDAGQVCDLKLNRLQEEFLEKFQESKAEFRAPHHRVSQLHRQIFSVQKDI